MEKLSVFVTTYNNDKTLSACLDSVKWANEIVLLDSFSTDRTLEIAEHYGCRIYQQAFEGYGPQKQKAMNFTLNNWVLLMDADEVLSPGLQSEIRTLMKTGPEKEGYVIPRQEQLFWRMCSTKVRMNHYLRLFNKRKSYISDMPIHAAPKVDGSIGRLDAVFYHYGEINIHTKVDKMNHYSTGLVEDKIAKGRKSQPWVMLLFYPPLVFLRSYLFKRNFLNGWAGFISSVTMAYYAFLKYAKLYEHEQFEKYGDTLLPDSAPGQPDSGADADSDSDSEAKPG